MYPRACFNISRAEQVMSFCAQTIYIWYDKLIVLKKNNCVLSKSIKPDYLLQFWELNFKHTKMHFLTYTHTNTICMLRDIQCVSHAKHADICAKRSHD